MTARLIVLRHAKSAWPEGVPDPERPLAGRGRRDAPAAGRWLREAGHAPDLVLCSTALRTRQTWDLVSQELQGAPRVLFELRLYAAGARRLRGVLREVPEERRCVLLIGHQPGVQDLVLSLAGGGDDEARTRVRGRFPTCAIAVLTVPGRWSELAEDSALLDEFTIPRGPVEG
ncbi:histidine phosphatase family protein [Streptomyces sp. NPDC051909]|uniref:SixA phosphatase family protein n=1 Tax=Streptomyces sp. NPDC051909 TaxID=3154944 RepID=UPI0034465C7F